MVNKVIIQEFQKVTGSTSEVAKQYLEISNWNIQIAITCYFDSHANENGNTNVASEEFRQPIPQKHERLVEQHQPLRQAMPTTSTEEFQLGKIFDPPREIMFVGTFEAAKEEARQSHKWLLVNIHNPFEFSCCTLNRDVWKDEKISNIVKSHFILWQVKCGSNEAADYTNWYTYNASEPHIAILDPITGESKLLLNCKSPITSSSIYSELDQFIKNNGSENQRIINGNVKKRKRSNKHLEQDNGIESSFIKKFKDSTEIPSTSYSNSFESNSSSLHVSITSNVNINTKKTIVEPYEKYKGLESDPKFSLLLRLPNGEREYLTLPSTSKLKAVFLYLHHKGYPINDYELVIPFPRRILTTTENHMSLIDCLIKDKETLYVQEMSS